MAEGKLGMSSRLRMNIINGLNARCHSARCCLGHWNLGAIGPVVGTSNRRFHQRLEAFQYEGTPDNAFRQIFEKFLCLLIRRTAIILIGGDKTGDKRFYDQIPPADRRNDEYLAEISKEGLIE